MNAKEQIKNEINELKDELNNVQGTETEIYSRIVGYYRSVKNWNKGKKEEYKYRKQFNKRDPKDCCKEQNVEAVEAVETKAMVEESAEYLYFYRDTCPNCPPVKALLEDVELRGQDVNVDTEAGLELARKYSIMSSPTVVFLDNAGNELYRSNSPQELNEYFRQIG